MDYHNAGGRALSTVAFFVFTAGAGAILLNDVLGGAPFTLKHVITGITFAGTLMVGHLASQARRGKRYWAMIGFGLLFLVGTGLVVFSSVGRQGESLAISSAQADAAAEARKDARDGLKRAQAMLAEAQAALGRECKTGRGKRCDGIQRTIEVYEAAARGEQAKLDKIGPAKPVSPEAERLAEIAAVFGADREKVKAGAIILHPFLVTLFLEFGGIVSGGFAFRGAGRKPKVEKPAVAVNDNARDEPSERDRAQTSFPTLPQDVAVSTARRMPKMEGKGLLKSDRWKYAPMRLN